MSSKPNFTLKLQAVTTPNLKQFISLAKSLFVHCILCTLSIFKLFSAFERCLWFRCSCTYKIDYLKSKLACTFHIILCVHSWRSPMSFTSTLKTSWKIHQKNSTDCRLAKKCDCAQPIGSNATRYIFQGLGIATGKLACLVLGGYDC